MVCRRPFVEACAWSGRVALDRSPTVPLMSVREKIPFAVTPLMPVIRYAAPAEAATPVTPVRTVGELRSKGAKFRGPIEQTEYGRVIMLVVPGADDIQLYQPTHRLAYNL